VHSLKAQVQLAKIRAEIERRGQSIIACDELLALAPPKVPIRSQFDHIFATAQNEGWSLEFRPDGTVRFGELVKGSQGTIDSSSEDSVRQSA
jgi:hypothetical protein